MQSIEKIEQSVYLPVRLEGESPNSINKKIKKLGEKKDFLKNILSQRVQFSEVFNFIPANLTTGIWLDGLSIKSSDKSDSIELLLTGYGYDTENKGVDLIYNLLDKINRSKESKKLFKDIKIVNIGKATLEGFSVIKFSLKAVMK